MSKVTLTRVMSGLRDGADLRDVEVEKVVVTFTDDYGRTVSLDFNPESVVTQRGRVRTETYSVNTDNPVMTHDLPGQYKQSGPVARVISELKNALAALRD
jgi:hypothetical protein